MWKILVVDSDKTITYRRKQKSQLALTIQITCFQKSIKKQAAAPIVNKRLQNNTHKRETRDSLPIGRQRRASRSLASLATAVKNYG